MVFRRRATRRRPTLKRRFRRRMPMVRRPRRYMPPVARFTESYGTTVIIAPDQDAGGIFTGQLSQLANLAHYQGLYDLYRITGMKVTVLPRWSGSDIAKVDGGGGAITGQNLPLFYIAPNRATSLAAPASSTDILNDDGVKYFPLKGKRSFYLSFPKAPIQQTIGEALLTINQVFPNRIQPWLATGGGTGGADQSALQHYGFRWVMNTYGTPNTVNLQVVTTLYFQMKERD